MVVGGLPRRPLVRDREATLDHTIREAAGILGDAPMRLLFPESDSLPVDLPETESPHMTAC
jgi:hypothetical protein